MIHRTIKAHRLCIVFFKLLHTFSIAMLFLLYFGVRRSSSPSLSPSGIKKEGFFSISFGPLFFSFHTQSCFCLCKIKTLANINKIPILKKTWWISVFADSHVSVKGWYLLTFISQPISLSDSNSDGDCRRDIVLKVCDEIVFLLLPSNKYVKSKQNQIPSLWQLLE